VTSFSPYPFQQRVAELLLSGQNVILQAPTGAGKTWAAKLPFYRARQEGRAFPPKCIYAVPMRVLANQFLDDARKDGIVEVGILTGERPEDREFRGDLTFCTIDQVLSSFLFHPYSLSRRQGNLNAGAIASSYLVFDEFHLFDPNAMLPTTLAMLRMLRGIVPFLLMTATFSREMLDGLAKQLDAVVVPEDAAEAQELQSLASQQKTRRYHVATEPLTADAILASKGRRTLVVCNVVARAQRLYESLNAHPSKGGLTVRLLHSRFLQSDRRRIETATRRDYARDAQDSGRLITVATQAIEVGMDITCDVMHSELAPANAILQRAGRCARYASDSGDVIVYRHTLDWDDQVIDLCERVMPYGGMEEEASATWEALSAVDGDTLGFPQEQVLVSRVHGPRDQQALDGIVALQEAHRQEMNAVWRNDLGASAAHLIRQVTATPIVIHDDPDAVAEAPFAYESFGLHTGTVYGLIKHWLESDEGCVFALCEVGQEEGHGKTLYAPCLLNSPEDARGALMLVVEPTLASYDPFAGLLPRRGGAYVADKTDQDQDSQRPLWGYRLETYADHANLVLAHVQRLWPEVRYAAEGIEHKWGWPSGILYRLAQAVALLHDTGKLSRGWQGWVRAYQSAIGQPVVGFYAHTERNPLDTSHYAAEKQAGRRPSHAAEGALAAAPLLARISQQREAPLVAAFSAIGRHHGAFTQSYQAFRLEPGAQKEVSSLMRAAGLEAQADLYSDCQPEAMAIASMWPEPDSDRKLLPYMLLARLLISADHAATAQGSSYTAPRPQQEDAM